MSGFRVFSFFKKVLVVFVLAGIAYVLCIDKAEKRVEKSALQYKDMLEDRRRTEETILPVDGTKENKEGKQKQKNESPVVESDKDYAGYIDCLIEIPKINMCRLVITGGNVEENLSHHYFTAARSSMSYGKGSYVIFGHQSFTKGKGMNRVDELELGDLIYISGESFEDVYEVTEILESHKGEAVEDFTAGSGHLALYSCRKQHERPKPYVIIRAVKRS